ncbi:MAG: DUF697 domain-containing protein [Leptolyngbya sp.]|nr:DUF697 domain-containing protein [Leptolyngbya sp.]
MAVKQFAVKQFAVKQFLLKRPLLVGGLGISATLGLLGASHLGPLDGSTLLSALALGSGLWWWQRGRSSPPAAPRPVAAPVVDRARVVAQLETVRILLETLGTEAAQMPEADPTALDQGLQGHLEGYESQRQALIAALDRTPLKGLVTGDPRSGKSTLLRHLQGISGQPTQAGQPSPLPPRPRPVTWTEEVRPPDGTAAMTATPGDEASPGAALAPTAAPAQWADLVLWVTEGDLTASALAQLRHHVIAGQGVMVVFNKTDHYTPADRQTVLTQLQRQRDALPGPVTLAAVAANPRPMTVRRHQENGDIVEYQEAVPPQLADLDAALGAWLERAPDLVAATTLRQGEALRQRIQQDLNQVRRQRAMPLIDQLQWVAGGAALANPVPSLDMLATLAINGQLLVDLGKIYGFNLSLEEAKAAATTLADLTVKLGLVELSTQMLTTVLKGHVATYLAGGMVQGMSAAYLTRMVGLSAVDYFEQAALAGTPGSALSWEAMAQRLATAIQSNRQITLVQTLVNQGLTILKPTPEPARIEAQAQAPVALTAPEDYALVTPSRLSPGDG